MCSKSVKTVEVALQFLPDLFQVLSGLSFQSSTIQNVIGMIWCTHLNSPSYRSSLGRALASLRDSGDGRITNFRRFVIWHCCGHFIVNAASQVLPGIMEVVQAMVEVYEDSRKLLDDFHDIIALCLTRLSLSEVSFFFIIIVIIITSQLSILFVILICFLVWYFVL